MRLSTSGWFDKSRLDESPPPPPPPPPPEEDRLLSMSPPSVCPETAGCPETEDRLLDSPVRLLSAANRLCSSPDNAHREGGVRRELRANRVQYLTAVDGAVAVGVKLLKQ